MAPIKKRTTARTKSSRAARPTPTPLKTPADAAPSSFSSLRNKKDKQKTKHTSFLSKIEKSSYSPAHKRRRPSKKLVATLTSLADALPSTTTTTTSGIDASTVELGQARITTQPPRRPLKSMKSRPGAQKRREKLEKVERERFNMNLVALAGAGAGAGGEEGAAKRIEVQDRWAALKSHVQRNMEVKEGFGGK
ncbi:hypothetical protein ACN47E_005514 [Coniothyrium glycines]